MSENSQKADKSARLLDPEKVLRRQKMRDIVDVVARHGVGIGGVSVIIAITVIFFYLAWVVVPLFKPVTVEKIASYPIPGIADAGTVSLSMEEQGEVGMRLTRDGNVNFFETKNGNILSNVALALPRNTKVSSSANGALGTGIVGLGLSNGSVIIFKYGYAITYPDNKRLITPKIEYPLGEKPISIFKGRAVTHLAVQSAGENSTVVAIADNNATAIVSISAEESFLGDAVDFVEERGVIPDAPAEITFTLIDRDQSSLYLVDKNNQLSHYNLSDKTAPRLIERVGIAAAGKEITDIRFMAGGVSLLVSSADGKISQWFTVRDQANVHRLTRIREFNAPSVGSSLIEPEYFRKGFLVATENGQLGVYHTTANAHIKTQQLSNAAILKMAIAPRADHILVEDASHQIQFWKIENKHPEISWSALWDKVWYEGYQKPEYIWQSSSASNDFEPKFSLAPLTFGTLKAAFYAMMIAIPLAILGAAYAAYFMSRRLRQVVKPTIEVMEALPTVILGFLAGLWLAPFVEENLPGVFSLTIILPVGVIVFAYLWNYAPQSLRHAIPDGWQPLLLVPVIGFLIWFAFALSPLIEDAFFAGDMPGALRAMGIDFDQRNALVVGIAMGFAVIPNIFSIAEDAIFAVPKHLTSGSLALGATPWQTFVRVVLPTASPGIFSAGMIGLGRAVGETMIVLMATGNTPVMEMNIFEGLRTLSANIAVEMPESEVNSTHYRVLFLAALVLFLFTFVFNTLAEIIRQRLRRKYGNL